MVAESHLIMITFTGTSGQIAVVISQFDEISEPELILRPVGGTGEQVLLSLSPCNLNAFISEEFDFSIGPVNFQLVANDTNGVMFEHSIQEIVSFPTC